MSSLFRSTVWFLQGLQSYNASGYEKASKSFSTDALLVDLEGKLAIVTGTTSGLGKITALELARRGATVHAIVRDKAKGESVLESFGDAKKNIILHVADMSRPKDIAAFISAYKAKHNQCHVLVNNAGILPAERVLTPDGIETAFATNTLGTFQLTNGLMDVLVATPHSRVVTVSSGGMLMEKLNAEDPELSKQKFDGASVYSQTKVELTDYWAAKYPQVKFFSMHPGWSDTPGVQKSLPGFRKMMQGRLRSEEMGADTIVWAAISPEADQIPSGSFLEDRRAVSKHMPLAFTQVSSESVQKFVDYCISLLSKTLA